MKILVIPSWHPTPEKPLWCTWVLPHIAALREAGHDVYVLQVDIDLVKDSGKLKSGEIIQRNKKHIFTRLPVKFHKYYRTRFFYGSILHAYSEKIHELYKKIEKNWGKPDVIHAHVSLPAGYGAVDLGKRENIPVVVTEHYSGFESDSKFWWRVGSYVREMAGKIQGFYTVSPGNSDRIERTGLVSVSGVLPNPIDTKVFSPKDVKRISKKLELVSAGGLSHGKGTDVLFDALKLIGDKVDWHLSLFGNVDKKFEYIQWLEEPLLSRRVTLMGIASQDELAEQYSKSDLYIVSSRVETANVSMLEAMACGIPVVSTRCGAPETLLDDSVSITVPSENPKAMAEAILTMSNTIGDYKKEELREFVIRNYSKKAVADKMINAYQNAIDKTNQVE
jgi:L-malate glycosyltransferase